MRLVLGFLTLLFIALTSMPARSIGTRVFMAEDAAAFNEGELRYASVHSDGTLRAGPVLQRVALGADVPVAFAFARARDASYVGTGHEGKVFVVRGTSVSLFAETHQLLVTSLLLEGSTLYAATLPEGRIFAIPTTPLATNAGATTPNGARELVRLPDADHVWALAWDARERRIVAGTGPNGKIFSIDPSNGAARVLHDADVAHILSLAIAPDGVIFAGTSDHALVLRLAVGPSPRAASVVADLPGHEVSAMQLTANGALLAVANEFPEPISVPTTTTTVPRGQPATSPSPRPRNGKGVLVRIEPGGRSETLYLDDATHFASLDLDDASNAYLGLGKDGRVVRVARDRTFSTIVDVDERQIAALDFSSADPVFVTSDTVALYRVTPSGAPAGDPSTQGSGWTSKVFDAGAVARFGALVTRSEGRIAVSTRSGNTPRPDSTWNDWANVRGTERSLATVVSSAIVSPPARYLQLRVSLGTDANVLLRSVRAYYAPLNQRAVIRAIEVNRPERESGSAEAGSPSALRVTWRVDNPDGDRLRYRVRFRSEEQTTWRDALRPGEVLVRAETTFQVGGLPDGYYRVLVDASDELVNAEGEELSATLESAPFLVDNHAPAVSLSTQGRVLSGRVVDTVGPITRVDFAVDGRDWRPVAPRDGMLDTRTEEVSIDLRHISPGAHIVAVRAYDDAGNIGSAELEVR